MKDRGLTNRQIISFHSNNKSSEGSGGISAVGKVSEFTSRSISAKNKEKESSLLHNDSRPVTDVQIAGAAVDSDEFARQAEEKAMQDAMTQMVAMKSRNLAKGGNFIPTAHQGETNMSIEFERANHTADIHHAPSGPGPSVEFRGVQPNSENAHLFKVENITQLSFMIYRLVKTHNIVSITDLPCTSSMIWMPEVLERLEFEVPHLHYRCIVPNDESLVEGVLRYRELSSPVILKDPTVWASKLPAADLAFAWYGLGFLPPERSWQLLKALQKSGTKYVIVPNFPDLVHNPAIGNRHGRINVRKAPYRFSEPLRVVNNMSAIPNMRKQLFMYDVKDIRKDLL